MDFLKRIGLYLFIILLLASIYKDLTFGTDIVGQNNPVSEQNTMSNTINVIKVKVGPGDTVLSIVEKINADLSTLDIEQIMFDFKSANPNADPYNLRSNAFYYFPLYK